VEAAAAATRFAIILPFNTIHIFMFGARRNKLTRIEMAPNIYIELSAYSRAIIPWSQSTQNSLQFEALLKLALVGL
jgi:hypothetical protein